MKKITLMLVAFASSMTLSAQSLKVEASNPEVRYVGRTVVDGANVTFDWAGTYLEMNFSGDRIKLRAGDSGTNYYNVVVDGKEMDVVKITGADTTVTLASDLGRGNHTLMLQKRTEGSQGRATLKEFIIEGKNPAIAEKPAPRERHIEFIGDSYTCGYGVEAAWGEGFSGKTENCNLAHGALLARLFDADYTFIANSGRGVVRNYGEKTQKSDTTMRELMVRTLNTQHEPLWDYAASPYTPDAVVIFLGINDFSTQPQPTVNQFKEGYKEIISTLRKNYGSDLPILCIATTTSERILASVEEMKEELGDSKLYYLAHTDNMLSMPKNYGADAHPNEQGQLKIAMATAPYLSSITGWDIVF